MSYGVDFSMNIRVVLETTDEDGDLVYSELSEATNDFGVPTLVPSAKPKTPDFKSKDETSDAGIKVRFLNHCECYKLL